MKLDPACGNDLQYDEVRSGFTIGWVFVKFQAKHALRTPLGITCRFVLYLEERQYISYVSLLMECQGPVTWSAQYNTPMASTRAPPIRLWVQVTAVQHKTQLETCQRWEAEPACLHGQASAILKVGDRGFFTPIRVFF